MNLYNSTLISLINPQFNKSQLFLVIWWAIMCFWSARSIGSTIDVENRDSGGKPYLIYLPQRYQWMFKQKTSISYAEKNKILLASVIIHLLGYMFGVVELVLLLCITSFVEVELGVNIATDIFVLYCLIVGIGIVMPNSIRYEKNMRRTYEYDRITYIQEVFSLNPKRRCYIVSHIEGEIYEIEVGWWKKRKYLAKAVIPLNIGDHKYAVHVYEENGPYWKIKNH